MYRHPRPYSRAIQTVPVKVTNYGCPTQQKSDPPRVRAPYRGEVVGAICMRHSSIKQLLLLDTTPRKSIELMSSPAGLSMSQGKNRVE